MKIALIKPAWPYPYSQNDYTYNRFWPPLDLVNCAAILEKNGFEAKIIDCHALRIRPQEIKKHVRDSDRVFVTSSPLDRWQCPNTDISPFLETVREIKKITAEVFITGYHGTVDPVEILNLTGAKAVIRGEPEGPVLELCRNRDLFNIRGISFKKQGEIFHASDCEPMDLKMMPAPAFHLVDFKKYSHEILGRNFSLFEINRGCKFRCVFCNKIMYGEGLRSKSFEQISEELRLAIEECNVRTACFMDLDFLANRQIAALICDFLIKKQYKFRWTCQTRPDLLDKDILLKMRQAGCSLIKIGVETGQQKLLDRVNKSLASEKIEEAVKMCRDLKIRTLAFFLLGLPGEIKEDRQENLKFIKKLNPDFVSFHRMIPYKGSAIFGRDSAYSDKQIDRDIRKAYLGYYLRPSYLLRMPPSLLWAGLNLFWGRIWTLK